ncbi:hypothetical protein YK48G_13470 [Lentilactobacillus fungorum]|uniref:Uncharacterized protein n=2 Tax=Lentilactobacillus fungorum TaxID=2201250 RepID=A0ABQ3W0B5_9LACO|nr:hypothetical protein YK48G_13470 [Lentilactobacillus fungorum]
MDPELKKYLVPVKNPMYIEQYGFTYADPGDYDYLYDHFRASDTSAILFIDPIHMSLINHWGMTYSIKPYDPDNYKPIYWHSMPSIDDHKVRQYLESREDELGVSILKDYMLVHLAVNAGGPTTELPVDPPEEKVDRSDHFGDFWSGFLAGGLMNGGWGHRK